MKNTLDAKKYEYKIMKSKFIGYAFNVSEVEKVESILEILKKEHKRAKHICFGYKIIENDTLKIKSSDAGEPKGSASIPIMNVVENSKLTNIVIVVIRYFGGIKLGLGELYRSYSKTAKETLNLINTNYFY